MPQPNLHVVLPSTFSDARCTRGHVVAIPSIQGLGHGVWQVTDGRRRDLVVDIGEGSPYEEIDLLVHEVIFDIDQQAPNSHRATSFRKVLGDVFLELIPLVYGDSPNGESIDALVQYRGMGPDSLPPCCPVCGSTVLNPAERNGVGEASYAVVSSSRWSGMKPRERRDLVVNALA